MTMTLPLAHDNLIERLRDPESLCGKPGQPVEVVQTHASTVLLCGDLAFKLKKPVRLGFLDFSTLAHRQADCAREVELNRRLAPDIYLGLSAVVRRGGGVQMVDSPRGTDEVLEWAVRMRRMPAGGMLDRLVPSGGVTAYHVRAFARQLAEFHARAGAGDPAAQHGSVEHIATRLRTNIAALVQNAGGTVLEREFADALRQSAERWIARVSATLEARRAKGRVRDGHGDLHARNLCMIDGRIVAYDCLEFDDALRCADVAADVGFLAMDLARLGRSDLAQEFVGAYVESSGDAGIHEPASFFAFHYAIVRAMVESIRLTQADTPDAERPALVRSVGDFAMLAAGYAAEPATVLMMGLPATGKSTLGRALARHLRATVIESDRVRKELHGLAATDRGPAEMYSADATRRTYAELAERARATKGSVVIDASHHTRAERASSIGAALCRGGCWLLLEVDADRTTIESRLRQRAADPSSVSDATLAVHERLLAHREAPTEVDRGHHMVVRSRDGEDWIEVACQRALTALMLSCGDHGVP